MASEVTVGILVFPNVQQLDFTCPFEVFTTTPNCKVVLVWKDTSLLRSNTGLAVLPDVDFQNCPVLDVLLVPGGSGVNDLLQDNEVLDFIRHHSTSAKYITSVCTGALVLGAAGLLRGKRASTHWMSLDFLARFGAVPVDERVVWDENIATAGGVTSGIDFALTVVEKLFGRASAEYVQLYLQYAPAPPFTAGHPSTAPPEVVQAVREASQKSRKRREEIIGQIAIA